jgi:SAM-dependent methyltransferase
MRSLEQLQRNWDGLAQADPFWAICTDPARRQGKWGREEFFATGESEIKEIFKYLSEIEVVVDWMLPALDFGCGVGRLTRAMAAYFPECCGVDIAPTMIELARQLNSDRANCRFVLNQEAGLKGFRDGSFGFIYTSIVLQHIPSPYSTDYLLELIRLLQPGGVLVFQVLDHFCGSPLERMRQKLALRHRWRKLIKATHGNEAIELYSISEERVRDALKPVAASVVNVRFTNSAEPDFNGRLRYIDSAPKHGYVSKQYVVVKAAILERNQS